ncbi:hypothetical protein [Melittangium boletus]|uniref:Uncharacterized protein n=1 Tax=Melittangium boletus DSM 14713 TaxID=1294270 RepID=A0A250IDC9_9BACT|nr:hypothetical protein [Melittangium boletus]ATB29864.1 hypothetical protein MEBOL_003319 [Melittangium boletus DSM 14713]
MNLPLFDLQLVKQLAEEDRFALGTGPACMGALESYLHGELGRYRPFAQEVIRLLCVEDFFRTKRWPEPEGKLADEYGVRLPRQLLEEFELDVSTWYVKVEVQKGRKGQLLFFMSLHPLAFEMHERNGGVLRPDK